MRRCGKCGQRRNEATLPPRARVCGICQRKARKQSSRAARIKATYDITMEEYDEISALQGGHCGGCGGTRSYNLHVDHDHKIEREVGTRESVRGLLCANCNGILRKLRDSIPTLRGLLAYMEDPPARKVLDP